MISLTTTIQEITLQAYSFGVFNYLFEKRNDCRDEIFNRFEAWGKEFEEAHKDYHWNGDYYDEIDEFVMKKYLEVKLEDMFPGGIAVGDALTYEGGLYKITGLSERGIAVEEIIPGTDKDWVVTEIGFSQYEKVKILDNYEEIMDTTNNHDAELVAKINEAWNTDKREQFCPILIILYHRDLDEILKSDAYDFSKVLDLEGMTDEDIREAVFYYLQDNWDIEAYNYLMHIADDLDLKTILTFLRVSV